MFLQVVLPRARGSRSPAPSAAALGGPAVGRHGDRLLAAQVLPGERLRRGLDLRRRAGRGDRRRRLSPGAGAEVEQVIGRLDHLAVVLDQEQRVAQVAELLQRPEQPARCRAGAGRSSARRARRARRSGRCRSGWPGGCAALSPPESVGRAAGRASGNRGRRRPGTAGGCGSRGAVRRRSAARRRSSFSSLKNVERLAQRPAADLVERVAVEPDGRGVVAQPAAACRRRRRPRRPGARACSDRRSETRAASSRAGNRPLYWKREAPARPACSPARHVDTRSRRCRAG